MLEGDVSGDVRVQVEQWVRIIVAGAIDVVLVDYVGQRDGLQLLLSVGLHVSHF